MKIGLTTVSQSFLINLEEKFNSSFNHDGDLPFIAQATFNKVIRGIEAEFSSLSKEKVEMETAFLPKPLTYWLNRGFKRYQKCRTLQDQDITALSVSYKCK